ncbi:aldo/keto reductase [Jatrophihabitans sp. DSM 45814]
MTTTLIPTTALGRTGMDITRVGFGAWALGGGDWAFSWGPQDDDEAVGAIRYALSTGINWIDTAAVYGLGHSEEVVARALRDIPLGERPYVFTKGGLVWDDADRTAEPRRVGDPKSLRRELEMSLRRLEVEQIDLYQMHWPSEDGTKLEDYWQVLLDFKQEGKVRAVGLSNHSVKQLERAEILGHVDTLQPQFSAIHRDAASDLLPWSSDHATGVIVYSPMMSGLLTGSFTKERVEGLPRDDWRRTSPDFTTNLAANLTVAQALEAVADRHGVSTPAAAVAWVLLFEGVSGAIVGARGPAQVEGWLPGAQITLTERDINDIATAVETSGAGEGPSHPNRPKHPLG